MLIEYETSRCITENKKIEIEDPKNVFLKGLSLYEGLTTYFGVWKNANGLSIITIRR